MPYAQFAKPLTVETEEATVQETINRYLLESELMTKLLVLLRIHNGKKITKRIETDLNKRLPRYRFSIEHIASQNYLNVYREDTRQIEKVLHLFLGYDSESVLDYDKRLENDWQNTLNLRGHAQKLQESLKVLPELVSEYNRLIKDMQALVERAKPYGLEYTFDILVREKK